MQDPNANGRFSDSEWAVLGVRADAVLQAQEMLRLGRGIDAGAVLAELPPDAKKENDGNEMAAAMRGLIAADDQPDDSRRRARAAYLDVFRRAADRLKESQLQLQTVTSPSQEGILMGLGVLDAAYDGPVLPPAGAERNAFLARLRRVLAVAGDPEWHVIEPKIVQVLDLQQQLQAGCEADPLGLLPNVAANDVDSPLVEPAQALAKEIAQRAPSDAINKSIAALREARHGVAGKLAAAQRSLSQVLDFHQEGVLMRAGILDPVTWN